MNTDHAIRDEVLDELSQSTLDDVGPVLVDIKNSNCSKK